MHVLLLVYKFNEKEIPSTNNLLHLKNRYQITEYL